MSRDALTALEDCLHRVRALRSQHGSFHAKMRQIFPSACYIGFTGTPLLKAEKATVVRFGDSQALQPRDVLRPLERIALSASFKSGAKRNVDDELADTIHSEQFIDRPFGQFVLTNSDEGIVIKRYQRQVCRVDHSACLCLLHTPPRDFPRLICKADGQLRLPVYPAYNVGKRT